MKISYYHYNLAPVNNNIEYDYQVVDLLIASALKNVLLARQKRVITYKVLLLWNTPGAKFAHDKIKDEIIWSILFYNDNTNSSVVLKVVTPV